MMRFGRSVSRCLQVACILLATQVHGAVPLGDRADVMPLWPITPAELTSERIRGAGCAWSMTGDRSLRFVASGDRAIVKLDGRFRRLKPMPDAAEMFPYTFDRWTGDGIAIRIEAAHVCGRRNVGKPRARLQAVVGGRAFIRSGVLDCGD